jgi:hypothetical protein
MGELARVGVREFTEERLTFRKIPWIVWLAGTIINIISLYLIYHLALGHMGGVLFKGYQEGHWWQYLLSFILLGLGIAFICAGKVETIIFSKEDGIVTFSKTNCICQSEATEWSIDQIANVRVFKRGHESIQIMTIHYEV